MKPEQITLAATTLLLFASMPAFADTRLPNVDPSGMWECPQANGGVIYTNKEKAGCREMTLRPLSVVPNLENMPTIPRTVAEVPHYQMPSHPDRSPAAGQNVPDWARDWRAGIAPETSVHEEVCSLYSEWLTLVQKTRGGFFYGSDPSYGSDLSGRNQRGPSYSFYDNARYVALSRMFGTGFVPVGCQ